MVYRVTKNPWLGAVFVIIFGPFGFLYYSWKKAVVAFLLFFVPNMLLYSLDSTLAEIIRWSVQLIMALFVYLDLKGKLYLLDDAFSIVLSTISIPIIFLNFFGGLVSGIWLLILGQWKLVIAAFVFSLFVPWAYSIVTIVQMPMMALIVYFQKKSWKIPYLIIGFINILIGHVIILFYVFFILDKAIAISLSRDLNIFVLLLFGYGIATGPFSYMASKEGPDASASVLSVFVAQISYLIFATAYLLNYPAISIPIILLIVFGIEVFQLFLVSKIYEDEEEEAKSIYIENKTNDLIQDNKADVSNEADVLDILESGLSLLKNKSYDQALINFNEVIETDSSIKEAFYYRAVTNKALDRKELIISDLRNAADLGHQKSIEILQNIKLKKIIFRNDPTKLSQLEFVVIVDDQKEVRDILVEYFKSRFKYNSIEFIEIDNGNSALEFIKKHANKIKLVISDINHLGLNGIELLKICSKTFPEIKFIIQSAFLTEENLNECKLYTDFVFHKPIKLDRLLEIIKVVLNNSNKHD